MTASRPEATVETLHTEDLPRPVRMRKWSRFVEETFAVMNVMTDVSQSFRAELSRIQLGDIGLSWFETTASAADVGGEAQPGAWSTPIHDAFLLAVQETGTCTGHHLGREIVTQPGDMVLLDATRPWRVTIPGTMRIVTIRIPADRVLGIVEDPELICGRRLGAEMPQVALGGSLLISIKQTIAAHPAEAWDAKYGNLLVEIIGTIVRALPPMEPATKGVVLRRKALAVIEQHLSDPVLGAESIAESIGTSTRTVQRLFLEIGFTPRRYILERRIAVASDKLRRGAAGQPSITEIAYAVGFEDLSHFTRSFRQIMGVSPRQHRAGRGTRDA